MSQPIEGPVRTLLEGANFGSVATLRSDGTPAVNVTWVDVDGDHVVLNSAEGRAWPRNLRRDPRVTIAVVNASNPYEYAQIRGRVVEETQEGADEQINKLAKRYLDKDEYPFRQPGEQRVLFRIAPDKITHQG